MQQSPGPVSRSVPGVTVVNVGQWYLLEAVMGLESSIGANNGTLQQYITPFGGSSTKFCDRSDIQWRSATLTAGFNQWKLNNIYGGAQNGIAKTRIDYTLFGGWRMRGF